MKKTYDEKRTMKEILDINKYNELQGVYIPAYRAKKYFITIPEYKLLKTLEAIYEPYKNIEIFMQVAINQIIEFNDRRAHKQLSYFKVEDRSIDFVIYNTDKKNCGIEYCIELNDKSHNLKDRTERDRIIKDIFKIAEIDLKFIKLEEIEKFIKNEVEYFSQESVKKLLNLNI